MKTKLITLTFVLFATISFAQSTSQAPIQNISTDMYIGSFLQETPITLSN
jgi:hypothetical protein